MAKELPYFKFEPSEWENGLIQICSRESKGLFIDIISIYWQRLGDLPYRYVLQKLCNGNANALKELTDENIIKIDGENIVIRFLDEQLKEFNFKSKQASDAAKSRWEKHNKNGTLDADAMQTHSERNAIREDKSIVDKKKEYNIHTAQIIKFSFDDFWELYPNKVGKKRAKEKFNRLSNTQVEKIENHLPLFIQNPPFKDYSFPHPTTYLNQERFEDEIQISNLKNTKNERFNQLTTEIRKSFPNA